MSQYYRHNPDEPISHDWAAGGGGVPSPLTISGKIAVAVNRLDSAIKDLKPIAVFGLFSGGHDSFSASFVASQHPSFTSIVHINTGIGIEATRDYVRDTCAARKWKLIELKAAENKNSSGLDDPQIYDDLILAHGFPGPGHHGKMYNRLKERALRMLAREFGANCRIRDKKRILLVSGCRSHESTRRMANTEERQIDGRRIWCAPIHDWTKCDTSDCLEFANQPRNIVVDLIHKSGECLCGAFGKGKAELEELKLWPQTRPAYERIIALQERCRVAGVHCAWGTAPPKEKKSKLVAGELCHSCKY